MSEFSTLTWIAYGALAAVLMVAALFWALRAGGLRRRNRDPFGTSRARDPLFLFDGPMLLDASRAGHALLNRAPAGEGWSALNAALAGRFPGFPTDPGAVQETGPQRIKASDDSYPGELLIEWIDGITRVHLRAPGLPSEGVDSYRLQAAEAELDSLRVAMDAAPYPIWQMDTAGQASWFNAAYAALYRRARKTEVDGSKPLFDIGDRDRLAGSRVRVSVPLDGSDSVLWYDVLTVPHEGFGMYYAVDVNAVVSAEIAQRNFVQTLAKTFAQLSIGLAIFDRNRQLALFNPALIDLTNLPADFLSARPNLLSFFDRLRDNRMMPEPKNYSSWRHQMADLVAAATDGNYMETWSLPSGSIYKVSGRPHPDGAVAFLFEDITADVTLTRRFRSELELWQSLLDQCDTGLAVFQPDGTLSLTNAAYRQFWQVDPDSSFAEISVTDAIRHWQAQIDPSPALAEIRDYVMGPGPRDQVIHTLRLRDGTPLHCTLSVVDGGSTLVRFALPDDTGQNPVPDPDPARAITA